LSWFPVTYFEIGGVRLPAEC